MDSTGLTLINGLTNSTMHVLYTAVNRILPLIDNLSRSQIENRLAIYNIDDSFGTKLQRAKSYKKYSSSGREHKFDFHSINYDFNAGNPPTANSINSTSLNLSSSPIMAFIWFNNDPDNRPSDIAFQVDHNGIMTDNGSISVEPSDIQGPLIQYTGSISNNNNNQTYIIYNKNPLHVTNITGSTIQVITMASSTNRTSINDSFGYPANLDSNTMSKVTINPGNRKSISAAYPCQPFTTAYIWKGNSPSVGAKPDYAINFTGYNFNFNNESASANSTIRGNWNSNGNLIINNLSSSESQLETTNSVGQNCDDNSDCSSNNCVANECNPVQLGAPCINNSDCTSGNCAPISINSDNLIDRSLSNIINGSMVCAPTNVGSNCQNNSDCSSGICNNGSCTPAPVGSNCMNSSDCSSNNCVNNVCMPVNVGSPCMLRTDCITNNCLNGKCGKGAVGAGCINMSDCTSNSCNNGLCTAVSVGRSCSVNSDCTSNSCSNNRCVPVGNGQSCQTSSDCISKNCILDICLPSGETIPMEDNNQFPWWGWLIIAIVVAIIVIIIVVMIQRTSQPRSINDENSMYNNDENSMYTNDANSMYTNYQNSINMNNSIGQVKTAMNN